MTWNWHLVAAAIGCWTLAWCLEQFLRWRKAVKFQEWADGFQRDHAGGRRCEKPDCVWCSSRDT